MTRDRAFDAVRAAVEEMNEELDYDTLRDVSDDTPVFGGEDGIDSLSLVSLVVRLEELVEDRFERSVTLADEKAMSSRNSPYRTVGTLTDFVVRRMEGES